MLDNFSTMRNKFLNFQNIELWYLFDKIHCSLLPGVGCQPAAEERGTSEDRRPSAFATESQSKAHNSDLQRLQIALHSQWAAWISRASSSAVCAGDANVWCLNDAWETNGACGVCHDVVKNVSQNARACSFSVGENSPAGNDAVFARKIFSSRWQCNWANKAV